jgi:hypothetical protein
VVLNLVDGIRIDVNRPLMGRIRRIHTDLIRADPSDPPEPWSILLPRLMLGLNSFRQQHTNKHYPVVGLQAGILLVFVSSTSIKDCHTQEAVCLDSLRSRCGLQ